MMVIPMTLGKGVYPMEEYDSIIICGIPAILVLGVVMWFMRNLLDQEPRTIEDGGDPDHEFVQHSYWSGVVIVLIILVIGMFVLLMRPV
jgi:hypothetical protein